MNIMKRLGMAACMLPLAGIATLAQAVDFTPQVGTWAIDQENNGKPGRGFQMDVQNDVLVLYFYGYEKTGESTYWLAAGKLNPGFNEVTMDLGTYEGGMAFGDAFKNATYLGPDGTVTVRFTSNTTGEICLPTESCKAISAFNFGYEESAQSLLGTWLVSLTEPGTHGTSGTEGVSLIFDQLSTPGLPGVVDVAKGAAYFLEEGTSGVDQTVRADVECSRMVVPAPPYFNCTVKAPGMAAVAFQLDLARNAITGVLKDPTGDMDIHGWRLHSATGREVLPN